MQIHHQTKADKAAGTNVRKRGQRRHRAKSRMTGRKAGMAGKIKAGRLLSKLGKMPLPNLPGGLPNLPGLPKLPGLPGLPNLGGLGKLGGLAKMAGPLAGLAGGPVGAAVTLAPMLLEIAADTDRRMDENMDAVVAEREKISADVSALLESLNTEDAAKDNLANAQARAEALLDKVRNPSALALSEAQGMALQQQLHALETRYSPTTMTSLPPYGSNEEIVAGTICLHLVELQFTCLNEITNKKFVVLSINSCE